MLNDWMMVVVLICIVSAYFVGYHHAEEKNSRESSLRERQKFDTMKAMKYTKRGS